MVKRISGLVPRDQWQNQLESIGFDYHSEPIPYWDETAYYLLDAAEIDELKRISIELHQMCEAVVERIVRESILTRFGMPPAFAEAVETSWKRKDPSLYGRFDFALDAKRGLWKVLEYNADTPEILLESSRVQQNWRDEVMPEADQFNGLELALVQCWRQAKLQPGFPDTVHFMTATEYRESLGNVRYMASTAEQAGLNTEIISFNDFYWDHHLKSFIREDKRPIEALFKIFPWEWMFASGKGLADPNCRLFSFEPPWKYLLSNKVILAFLWKQFRGHPNLLATYFSPEAFSGPLIKKATCSRNSEQVYFCQSAAAAKDYGPKEYSYIYQEVCDIQQYENRYPIFGLWMVDNKPCAVGIREDASRISTDSNRFVPHVVV